MTSLLVHRRGRTGPPAQRWGLWRWGVLGGGLALIMHTSQQVISAHPEYRREFYEQLCPWLLFALLNLREMLAWLS